MTDKWWAVAVTFAVSAGCASSTTGGGAHDGARSERPLADGAGGRSDGQPDSLRLVDGSPGGSCRAAIATPITDLAGWSASAVQPTSCLHGIAVSPDGSKVAVAWTHNTPMAGCTAGSQCPFMAEPTSFATVGDPANPASFSAPAQVGKRPFPYASGCAPDHMVYNTIHNDSLPVALAGGAFLALTLGMNANGYPECSYQPDHYVTDTYTPGAGWGSTFGLAVAASVSEARTVSELNGIADGDGRIHLFGQVQVGADSGGMGYLRLRPGASTWDSIPIAASYRPTGLIYFATGTGAVSATRNSAGFFDVHVAFVWNDQGDWPQYGLYYLVSHDGGTTWQTASGRTVTVPIGYGSADEAAAAVEPAALTTSGYGGTDPATEIFTMALAPDGSPVILRLSFVGTPGTSANTQAYVWTYAGGKWTHVAVGGPYNYYTRGNGIAVRGDTQTVNVVLLDPQTGAGGASRVVLESEPLASLRAGSVAWTEQDFPIPGAYEAACMKVAAVPDCRFEVLVDPTYTFPGPVTPVLLETPMK